MASGIFAVLDDIATLMDDVSVTTKLATRKTAGIIGDDLAVNAEKATGFLSSREIPVLWAITKGSLLNKLIIIPVALLLNYFFPPAIKYILILGGFYLAYEGVEKIIHYLFHKEDHKSPIEKEPEGGDPKELEKSKIQSAITTDFILSIEIVIIALGTVASETLPIQIVTVTVVALLATVGVYGLVALIVRMDDIGYRFIKESDGNGLKHKTGKLLVNMLPFIIRLLGVVGTIALILVAGGIFNHNIDFLHHLFPSVLTILKEIVFGLLGGLLAFVLVSTGKKMVKPAE